MCTYTTKAWTSRRRSARGDGGCGGSGGGGNDDGVAGSSGATDTVYRVMWTKTAVSLTA